jgi:hypothetical protein
MNDDSDTDPALTVYEVAERWAGGSFTIGADTLARLLVERVVAGEIEVSGIAGNSDGFFELSFAWFADATSLEQVDKEYLHYAKNLKVRLSKLKRFCDSAAFGVFAHNHELKRPTFIGALVEPDHSTRSRIQKAENEARAANKIRNVITAAKAEWPDKTVAPPVGEMARWLCEKNSGIEFSEETVRKILSDRYPPMKRYKISRYSK